MAIDKQVAEEMMKYAQDAGSFVKEQAPLVVQELLTRGIIVNTLWLVGLTVFTIALIILAKKMYKAFPQAWNEDDPGPCLAFLAPMGALCTMPLFYLVTIYALCNIIYCPRLYVLEYLGSLVK